MLSYGQTVGLLYFDEENAFRGYTLFYPENQNDVFLIDNCGQIVHTWSSDMERLSGKEQYLDDQGRLYLACIKPDLFGPTFGTGGSGGVLEILDWDGQILWQHIVADTLERQHHDLHIMPNGNILYIVWENIDLEVAYAHGFDRNNSQIGFWPDKIVEINPATDEIVWQWRAFDHMIQDIDSNLLNYGEVSSHPERIDINYLDFAFGRQDVHHINSVDYNPELDLILLSVRNFNEIWIIDHSTTIEEAAGHSGGNFGHGGDLLYRWGNPAAYKSGDAGDQKLFRNHDASWIDQVPEDHPLFGKISVFNNFVSNGVSRGDVLDFPLDTMTHSFLKDSDGTFLPKQIFTSYQHPMPEKTYSTAGSNIQFLPDGHVVMCAARQGRIFELTPEGDLAWEYFVPLKHGLPVKQGSEVSISENFTFSGRKYSFDFPGFAGKDLTPKGFLELDPLDNCTLNVEDRETSGVNVYPNPSRGRIMVKMPIGGEIRVLDAFGRVRYRQYHESGDNDIFLDLDPGLYFLSVKSNGYHIFHTQKVLVF